MARRKAPQTAPVNDRAGAAEESNKVNLVLSDYEFGTFVQLMRVSGVDRCEYVVAVTDEVFPELGLKPDLSKVVKKAPKEYSSQVSLGAFKLWANKLTKNDKKAIKQLIAIDATARARMN